MLLQSLERSEFSEFLDDLLLPIVARCLEDMGPRELCTCLRALAILMHSPSPEWVSRLLESVTIQLPFFSPRDLSTLGWSLGKMYQTAKGLQESSLHTEVDSQSRSQSFAKSSPAPSTMLKDKIFMNSLELACLSCMCRFNPQDLSTLAVGILRLQHTPSPAWTEAFLSRVLTVLPQCGTQVWIFMSNDVDKKNNVT